MFQVFMVGAKLLGMYLIVNGAIEAGALMSPTRAAYGPQIALASFIHLTSGTILAFCTGFVAKAVRIRDDFDGEAGPMSYRSALEVGIVLISLFEILSLLPRVVMRWNDATVLMTRNTADLLNPETIGLLAAVITLLFAHRIAAFLERVHRRPSDPDRYDAP